MLPLNLVTVHHEGAGDPIDFPRGGAGGYTYWVGPTAWTRLRSPYDSYATLHYNHVSVDVCLSGDRDNWDVTNNDLIHLSQIGDDARRRGELVDSPTVRPHRWTFSTDCPGIKTMAKWNDVAARFHLAPPPIARTHTTLRSGDWGPEVTQLQHELNVGTGAHLTEDGAFGHLTLQAVCGFQAFFHLTVDGIVGPKTWATIDFCYAQRGGH